jgi:hypothetical protein
MIRKSGHRFSPTNGFVCREIMLKQREPAAPFRPG